MNSVQIAFDIHTLTFSPATLLIADDIASNRNVLHAYLKPFHFDIIECDDGAEAIKLTHQHRPDLILMDMKMPNLNGYIATQALKAQPETVHIPVIAVTATALKESENEIRTMCDGFLIKPVSLTEILSELIRFLPHSRQLPDTLAKNTPSLAKNTGSPSDTVGLYNELLTQQNRCETLKEILVIKNAEDFAKDMLALGEKHHYTSLINWATQLQKQSYLFDTNAIHQLLNQFSTLTGSVKQHVDS